MFNYIKRYMREFRPYKNGRWCYEDGILMKSLWDLFVVTKDEEYKEFVIEYYNKMIMEDGSILNYDLNEFNIDNICPGIVLFDIYEETKEEKYLSAIKILRHQLLLHPRNNEGSYFHKLKYRNQVWLDGIYMGLVFYTRYGILYNDNNILKDVSMQLKNVYNNLYDKERKLFVHAYDESKNLVWANKDGKSKNVWSRACGWLAMAYVDIASICNELKEDIKEYYLILLEGLKKHLNEGMLYQVVDRENSEGNYLETSGSAMLAYSILKGIRYGIVKKSELNLAFMIYESIKKNYFKYVNNILEIGGICQVAGLDNLRDGSEEYYYSEKKVKDEVKGVAPIIMLYSELLSLV